jgi:hypothetical protein
VTRGSGPETLATGGEKRSPFGRLLRFFLEPAYYWIDLKGADGRPSHMKVVGLGSFAFFLGLLFRLWAHFFTEAENGGPHSTGELAFLLSFSFLVALLPYGLKGLTVWAASRMAGAADVLAKAAEREPETLRARAELERTRAEIAGRREAGDGDYEAT